MPRTYDESVAVWFDRTFHRLAPDYGTRWPLPPRRPGGMVHLMMAADEVESLDSWPNTHQTYLVMDYDAADGTTHTATLYDPDLPTIIRDILAISLEENDA